MTRAREQAAELIRLLEAAGAQVLLFPAIRFAPPISWDSVDRAIDAAHEWLVFTSTNGVAAWFDRIEARGASAKPARVAAVGSATAAALRARGVEPDAVPERFAAAEVLPLLGAVEGSRVAVVRAEEGREELVDELRARGVIVDLAIAYRTLPGEFDAGELRRSIADDGIDVVTFTSPSTVVNLLAPLTANERTRLLRTARVVAIGATTAAAIRAEGREPDVIAARASASGIVEAVIESRRR